MKKQCTERRRDQRAVKWRIMQSALALLFSIVPISNNIDPGWMRYRITQQMANTNAKRTKNSYLMFEQEEILILKTTEKKRKEKRYGLRRRRRHATHMPSKRPTIPTSRQLRSIKSEYDKVQKLPAQRVSMQFLYCYSLIFGRAHGLWIVVDSPRVPCAVCRVYTVQCVQQPK